MTPTPESTSAEPTFDERLSRLEAIVHDLEDGGLDLEQAIAKYKEAVEIKKSCHTVLEGYRKQVEELTQSAENGLTAYDGDPDAS